MTLYASGNLFPHMCFHSFNVPRSSSILVLSAEVEASLSSLEESMASVVDAVEGEAISSRFFASSNKSRNRTHDVVEASQCGFRDGPVDQGIVVQIGCSRNVRRRSMMAFPHCPSTLVSVPNMERKLGVAYNHRPSSFEQNPLDFRLMAPWSTSLKQPTNTAGMPNPVHFATRL